MNTPIVTYDFDNNDLYVSRRCPKCGRYLSVGRVQGNALGMVLVIGWRCARHGEVQPEYQYSDGLQRAITAVYKAVP